MLSEETKKRQKEAKRLWYEKNKDYQHPDPEKHRANVRKASLAYYHRNKEEISTKLKKKTKQAHVTERINLLKQMNYLVQEESIMIRRITKPLALLF